MVLASTFHGLVSSLSSRCHRPRLDSDLAIGRGVLSDAESGAAGPKWQGRCVYPIDIVIQESEVRDQANRRRPYSQSEPVPRSRSRRLN